MSERYDYEEAVKNDIKDYFDEHLEKGEYIDDGKRQELYDDMFVNDSVTGNASGSYYCNSWKSEEAVCHNLDLLSEAIDEFGVDGETLREKMSGEWADVTIRCMMVGRLIDECVSEWNDAIDESEDSEDEEESEDEGNTETHIGKCGKCGAEVSELDPDWDGQNCPKCGHPNA